MTTITATTDHQPLACSHCNSRFESVFCKLKAEELEKIAESKSCVFYAKGQTIFQEGAYPQGLFCVNSGKIKLVKLGNQGKEQILRLSKGGDSLGYRSLLSNEPYAASAITLEDSSVCFIPKDVFLNMMQRSNALTIEVMNLLTGDLAHAEKQITHIAQHSLRERVAESILVLKETYGLEDDGVTLAVTLTREDMANMVGTATESVIRFLSEFKNDKMIELDGKKIRILDIKRLTATANLDY